MTTKVNSKPEIPQIANPVNHSAKNLNENNYSQPHLPGFHAMTANLPHSTVIQYVFDPNTGGIMAIPVDLSQIDPKLLSPGTSSFPYHPYPSVVPHQMYHPSHVAAVMPSPGQNNMLSGSNSSPSPSNSRPKKTFYRTPDAHSFKSSHTHDGQHHRSSNFKISPSSSFTSSSAQSSSILSPNNTSSTIFDENLKNAINTNVYVRGLPEDMTDDSFLLLCQTFGKIVSCKAMLDFVTHVCKGFGFVMYETKEECVHAIQEFEKLGYQASFARDAYDGPKEHTDGYYGTNGMNRTSMLFHRNSNPTSEMSNLYVSNLPGSYTYQDIQRIFEPYSSQSVKMLRNENSGFKGTCFIKVASEELARNAIANLNGKIVKDGKEGLIVRIAEQYMPHRKSRFFKNGSGKFESPNVSPYDAGAMNGDPVVGHPHHTTGGVHFPMITPPYFSPGTMLYYPTASGFVPVQSVPPSNNESAQAIDIQQSDQPSKATIDAIATQWQGKSTLGTVDSAHD